MPVELRNLGATDLVPTARKLLPKLRRASFHRILLDVCIALAPLQIPAYVLLHIVDWLPFMDLFDHRSKIELLQSIHQSLHDVKGYYDYLALNASK